jgi:hypothetical protein
MIRFKHKQTVLLQRPHFGALAFTLNIFRACLVGPLTFLIWLLLTAEDCNMLNQRKGWSDQVSVTWSAAITLPKVNRIKQVTRSTVNCVLLAALAGAARRLLQGCGVKNPPDMKVSLFTVKNMTVWYVMQCSLVER